LRRLWEVFAGDARFDQYCRDRGDELEHFATYCALVETQGPDWRTWPAHYHDCNGAAVQAFSREHARLVAYHKWLQWLLESQMAEAAREAKLIQDLPVGVDPGGADAWAWQAFLAKDCTVGAPPDMFNANGQDWQVPAFVPHKLRAAGYQPFVDTLRCVLRHAGGLRIDHVMGLFRLFWIPKDFGAARGAYVRYRPDELLAVVDIESHRAGAFIVGEDLGTIEHGMRETLAEHGILSFRVMWFEQHSPEHYAPLAMAAATTHDLATVAGLWDGSDLAEQKALGFRADEAMQGLRRHLQRLSGLSDGAPNADVVEKTYQLLGRAPCRLLVATLEDALAVPERPNLPGTVKERMNWSLALPGGLDALESAELPTRIARALARK
jgi:4-alpha-glucanotransferase